MIPALAASSWYRSTRDAAAVSPEVAERALEWLLELQGEPVPPETLMAAQRATEMASGLAKATMDQVMSFGKASAEGAAQSAAASAKPAKAPSAASSGKSPAKPAAKKAPAAPAAKKTVVKKAVAKKSVAKAG